MWLPVAALVSAALAIAASLALLPAPWLFVFKPLTTLLVIAHAWRRDGGSPLVRRWVLAGLVLSLVGDVALLWPRQGFLPGLVSFLLAHLAYIVAFSRAAPFAARRGPFVVYAAVAGAVLSLLWPGVPPALRVPVVLYVLCLVTMASQAAVVWRCAEAHPTTHPAPRRVRFSAASITRAPAVLALGGALFLLSDSTLAINKFTTPLPLSGLWILASYWSAQGCIASWLPLRGGTQGDNDDPAA
jgi:uncharacterized membrane protein YhhN